MYERTYGDNYDQNLSTKEIAVLIRKALKVRLPDYKFSTRYKSFSGGSSIDVVLKAAPHKILNARWTELECLMNRDGNYGGGRQAEQRMIGSQYNERTNEALATAKAIMDSYNHDGTQIQIDYFDVKFYGHVSVDWAANSEEREQIETLVEAGYRNINWKD